MKRLLALPAIALLFAACASVDTTDGFDVIDVIDTIGTVDVMDRPADYVYEQVPPPPTLEAHDYTPLPPLELAETLEPPLPDEPVVPVEPQVAVEPEPSDPVAYSEPEPETPPPLELSAEDYWLARLTIEEKIGQLIMIRLPWQTTTVNARVRNLVETIPIGGVILFADNVVSIRQVQALTRDLQALATIPMFIATDEEGGRVSRVGRLFDRPVPPAFNIGVQRNPEVAYAAARTIGQRLALLGINMNFAPVADIWSNPANTVIGNRAFGQDLETVGDMVEASVQGLASEGVLSVVKHFPGHGDTYEDSHYQLAFHPHGRERFDRMEAIPFKRGISAGSDGVMIGHISTPAFEDNRSLLYWMAPWVESGALPATFSDFWVQDVLRGEMGFDGLIITDALDMRALTDHFTCAQIALGAFLAGADILLMPVDPGRAFHALLDGYHSGQFDQERLNQSLRRIIRAKRALEQ